MLTVGVLTRVAGPYNVNGSLSWLIRCIMQEVLPYCHEHDVQDAEAFLLERLGDIPAALQVAKSKINVPAKYQT